MKTQNSTGIVGVVFAVICFHWNVSNTFSQEVEIKAPTNNPKYVQSSFQAADGTKIHYWLLSPRDIEEGVEYPVVLALHGRGGNTTAANVLGEDGLRSKYPCFVMAPTSTRAGVWSLPEGYQGLRGKHMLPAALEALDTLVEEKPIDTGRIYVTGQSMGGFGSFGAVAQRPDFFAAAIPICGGWVAQDAVKMTKTKIWLFHGDADRTVPPERSRMMFEAIKEAGGDVKYTEYPGVGHNSWDYAYESAETWEWLFAQTKGE